MQKIKLTLIFSILLLGNILYADCVYGGHTYSEGTIRGPFICIDGEWIKR